MTSEKIRLIGASCRAAAQSARRSGVQAICAWDDFLDADLVDIAESSLCATMRVDSLRIDQLTGIPLVLCGGMENKPELLKSLLECGMLCGVTVESMRQLRSLDCWKDWATCAGVGWPETYLATDKEARSRIESNLVGTECWLIKPLDGAGGIHIRRISDSSQIDQTLATCNDPRKWYFQRSIVGTSIGATYCSDPSTTEVVGIARSIRSEELAAPLPYLYTGNIAPYLVSEKIHRSLQNFGELVSQRTGVRGLWQADFQMDQQEQLWLLEINPRWSASMELHEVLQGFSWMNQHLRILSGLGIETSRPADRIGIDAGPAEPVQWIGKGIVYAPETIDADAIQVGHLWQSRWQGTLEELQDVSFKVADIPRFPEGESTGLKIQFPAGTPIATVLCSGNNQACLIRKLQAAREILLKWLQTS